MNYPVWEVPVIGTPWVVGIIAIFHVMISHFAVGGGLYLAWILRKAIREDRRDWLPMIKLHARFFMIVTGVFGTISGVGIWFAIGLVNPGATSALIHNFVFGWAIEWLFFAVELTAAVVFYYSFDRVPEKVHLQVAYVYAVASILTLVIINGILTFMLTPGSAWLHSAGTGNEPYMFWYAFFNPTYWPSLVMRILVCMALAGVWALVSFSRLEPTRTRDQLIRWSCSWLIPAFILMPFAFLWYRHQIPPMNRHLTELGMATIGSGSFTQITRIALLSVMGTSTIAAIAYFFAYQSPRDFTLGHAVSLLFVALMTTASTEYAREAIRKPFVIGSYMYSNGVRVKDVSLYQTTSYSQYSMWAPQGHVSEFREGQFVFRGECMSCHTLDGYRSIRELTASRDDRALSNVLLMLRDHRPDSPYRAFMPPLAANNQEIQALKVYLLTIQHKPVDPTCNIALLPPGADLPPAPIPATPGAIPTALATPPAAAPAVPARPAATPGKRATSAQAAPALKAPHPKQAAAVWTLSPSKSPA